MRARNGDFVRAGVYTLLAAVLLGSAWALWRIAEGAHSDDVGFSKVTVVENGHPTGQLKVCGDHHREPSCMRREQVTVRDAGYETKRSGRLYTLEVARADGWATEYSFRNTTSNSADAVYERARSEKAVTLFWWRGSVRMIQAGEDGDTVTVRTTHYPGRLFSTPGALASLLFGFGLGPLWSALWLLMRGRRHPVVGAWQSMAPLSTFVIAGGAGAGAALLEPRPGAVVRVFAVVAVVLLIPGLLWLRRWTRTRLPGKSEVEPVEPVAVRPVAGGVAGTGPWKLSIKGPLYVGPDVLGTTPDPRARVGLMPLPGPLRVITVRPPYRSDPRAVRLYAAFSRQHEEAPGARQAVSGRRSRNTPPATFPLVAVCEVIDGPGQGSQVLIGARDPDMPEVLGAITGHARKWQRVHTR
ncbi:hypothetical protein [Streptomyces tsukubensis]|uniref:Uncharacterized protein n=1 Tax=Streptomyces tsukubensis TaxID=83656 RepID=A0A1V4ACP2_9ACTN|nr:hypothetical protein [Streptomyces tsukubensis]OON81687.1 hypothetical protein B1H18_05920 [Streptomyces tsukubensis]QFR96462.1 hypothetical protein GBW32_29760 [Streptomyces tsukubensis]